MAHIHTAEILWQRGDQSFTDRRYSRRHTLHFDGGLEVPGSSSPLVVPLPWSDPLAMDPEEALVASISSCHMLWFLSIAAGQRFVVDSYHDKAVGTMAPNELGKLWLARVILHPKIVFSGERMPDELDITRMHHEAHEECFIANSVRTDIEVRARD